MKCARAKRKYTPGILLTGFCPYSKQNKELDQNYFISEAKMIRSDVQTKCFVAKKKMHLGVSNFKSSSGRLIKILSRQRLKWSDPTPQWWGDFLYGPWLIAPPEPAVADNLQIKMPKPVQDLRLHWTSKVNRRSIDYWALTNSRPLAENLQIKKCPNQSGSNAAWFDCTESN